MMYPIFIFLHHGECGAEYTFPTWVTTIVAMGVGAMVVGVTALLSMLIYHVLTDRYAKKPFDIAIATILIGIIITVIALVLMLLTGKPIE